MLYIVNAEVRSDLLWTYNVPFKQAFKKAHVESISWCKKTTKCKLYKRCMMDVTLDEKLYDKLTCGKDKASSGWYKQGCTVLFCLIFFCSLTRVCIFRRSQMSLSRESIQKLGEMSELFHPPASRMGTWVWGSQGAPIWCIHPIQPLAVASACSRVLGWVRLISVRL